MARLTQGCCFLGLFLSGCVGTPPPGDLPIADVTKITVFHNLEGRVRGRGSAGAFPGNATGLYAYIAAHPTATNDKPHVNEDGSFFFEISAGSNDVIEISAASDPEGKERGRPIFVQVPRTPTSDRQFFCCKRGAVGSCQPEGEVEPDACPSGGIHVCSEERDCLHLEGFSIGIADDDIEISQPDERSSVEIIGKPGKLPANALVRAQNRGKSAVGGPILSSAPVWTMTDDNGAFVLRDLVASGDDEFVLKLFDIAGYESMPQAVYVPDAKLKTLDIVGAFAFDALAPGQRGKIGIRLAPSGVDGNGICPDSNEGPGLCFSGGRSAVGNYQGGLDYSMVRIERVQFDEATVVATPAVVDVSTPYVKFADGDVLGGPVDAMLVLEDSEAANFRDPTQVRRKAARMIINNMRSRDRLGLVVYGRGKIGFKRESSPTSDKAALLSIIDHLTNDKAGPDDRSNLFGAVTEAAKAIPPRAENKRIFVIVPGAPSGTTKEFDEALDFIAAGFDDDGIPTYVVASGVDQSALEEQIKDLAGLSNGGFQESVEPEGMITGASELVGDVAGAFILLYDVEVPLAVGKTARITIDASLTIDGPEGPEKASGTYTGFIEVVNAN